MGCYNSCVVTAPLPAVWRALRNFHDLSWAKGVIDTLEVVGERASDQVGARRLLNGAIQETLLALDDEGHQIKYSIDDGPDVLSKDKVRGYVARITASPITSTDHTFVEWTATWLDGQGGVQEFCDPIYRAALARLTQHFS
jgi:hypothetical protein